MSNEFTKEDLYDAAVGFASSMTINVALFKELERRFGAEFELIVDADEFTKDVSNRMELKPDYDIDMVGPDEHNQITIKLTKNDE